MKLNTDRALIRTASSLAALFFLLILSGCPSVEGPKPPLDTQGPVIVSPPEPSRSPLEPAMDAFLSGRYDIALLKYSALASPETHFPALRRSARFGLACTQMVMARTPDEFRTIMDLFLQEFSLSRGPGAEKKPSGLAGENSELLALSMAHGLNLLNSEREDLMDQTAKLEEQKKKYLLERKKMKQLINTLKHQIIGLESIDHDRQEKRKAQ